MTATVPLPDDASDDSCCRALKEVFRSPTEIAGALALELAELLELLVAGAELELLLLELLELQAAISSAALTPAAVRPALFVREDTNVPRFLYTR